MATRTVGGGSSVIFIRLVICLFVPSPQVNSDTKILNMSSGVDMSMAVTTEGIVYAWGKTDEGRIGLGSGCNKVSIPRRVVSTSATADSDSGIGERDDDDVVVANHRRHRPPEPD